MGVGKSHFGKLIVISRQSLTGNCRLQNSKGSPVSLGANGMIGTKKGSPFLGLVAIVVSRHFPIIRREYLVAGYQGANVGIFAVKHCLQISNNAVFQSWDNILTQCCFNVFITNEVNLSKLCIRVYLCIQIHTYAFIQTCGTGVCLLVSF